MRKFICVRVYTGCRENSITHTWVVEGESKKLVYQRERRKAGGEDRVVVFEEGEKVGMFVEKDQNEWNDDEWDAWEEFTETL